MYGSQCLQIHPSTGGLRTYLPVDKVRPMCVCVCIFIVRDDALPWDTLVFPETRTFSYITTT